MRLKVGLHLEEKGRLRRGELARLAEALDLSPRTLRKWRAEPVAAKMGRHRLAREAWRAALRPVARAWKSQGRSAGLPRVQQRLEQEGHHVPISILRGLLRQLKARWRRRVARAAEARRVHVEVHARDALWSQDATSLGREGGQETQLLLAKDVATTAPIAPRVGGPATGADVLALLMQALLERGALPLVLVMDNGPANRCELVLDWLAEHQVVVLWNLPHTPQHNPWIEELHGEVKRELEARDEQLRRGPGPTQAPVCSPEPGVSSTHQHFQACLAPVVRTLNGRHRPSRGGHTAAELDRIRPPAEALVNRARFYQAACAAIDRAVQGVVGARARRRAEREAIWCTLEEFALVTRTRGRRTAACPKAERLS
jgi:hypothetical protein